MWFYEYLCLIWFITARTFNSLCLFPPVSDEPIYIYLALDLHKGGKCIQFFKTYGIQITFLWNWMVETIFFLIGAKFEERVRTLTSAGYLFIHQMLKDTYRVPGTALGLEDIGWTDNTCTLGTKCLHFPFSHLNLISISWPKMCLFKSIIELL